MDLEERLRAYNEQKAKEETTNKEENTCLQVPVWRDTNEEQSMNQYLEKKERESDAKEEKQDDPTYDEAFRLVQQAVHAETTKNCELAISLYTEAGNVLIKVGKTENDAVVKKGVQEKAYELLQRAEQLDKWIYETERQAQLARLPPAQRIQRTETESISKTWKQLPPYTTSPEFTHMRYTAVTIDDPIRFTQDGYALRCNAHHIRVLITVTMYNEEGSELQGTLTGIVRNLASMAKTNARVWEEYAVVVVSDGRQKANPTCLDYLSSLGAFNEEIMSVTSLGVQNVQLHLFESTLQLVENASSNCYYPPLQFIYALKEHNGGKLNSHLWFFNAFAEHLLPVYTVLVDVGTIPGETSIYRLIRSMDRNHQIGGVAGEIAVEKPNFFNPIIAAQHFEYKISNIMDKSLESVFGFISVLPGAFSAYRYEAIRAKDGKGPLPEYFRSLSTSTKELGPFKGNMYLAEDRILCFELLSRENCRWTMHYVKDAIARTDVPETLVNLIKQRRRWLNGSFFAGLFSIANFGRVWRLSSHSFLRKLILSFQFIYLVFQTFLSFFLLSNLFLTFYYVLIVAMRTHYDLPMRAILVLYSISVGGIIIFSLGNKPERRTGYFYSVAYMFYGLIMYAVILLSAGFFKSDSITDGRFNYSCPVSQGEIQIGILGAIGLIYLSAFLHGEFSILASSLQYFFLLPTFVNVIGIFAYSNLHDLSWGTKGLESGSGHNTETNDPKKKNNLKDVLAEKKRVEAAKQKAMEEKEEVENSFRAFRSGLLLCWLAANGIWIYVMTSSVPASCYLKYLSYIVICFNLIRFFGSFVFILFRIARRPFVDGCCGNNAEGENYAKDTPPEWKEHYAKRGIPSPNTENLTNSQYQAV